MCAAFLAVALALAKCPPEPVPADSVPATPPPIGAPAVTPAIEPGKAVTP